MINFKTDRCPKCGRRSVLMYSNNPLCPVTICFNCVANNLVHDNLQHADFFCRTYNLPFHPELWMSLAEEYGDAVFRKYTELMLEEKENQPNLAYGSTTHDLWLRVNREWEKRRTFSEILNNLASIKESYIERGRLKWGEHYTFGDLIQLDSLYTRTVRANNIINPLQREAVKALCKLHIEINEAIRAKDSKALKELSSSYSTFAKQADLEGMINETRTDDITTVAELYDYMEQQGFQFKFNDGYTRDEVDLAIKDMQEYIRKLVLESTGLQPLLEEMAQNKIITAEEEMTARLTESTSIEDLLNFTPEDTEIDVEDDEEVLNEDFSEDDPYQSVHIIHSDAEKTDKEA